MNLYNYRNNTVKFPSNCIAMLTYMAIENSMDFSSIKFLLIY